MNSSLFIIYKIKRLLVPYIFISAIWAIPIGQLFYHYSIWELTKRYLLATAPSQLWFLFMLFWCFVGAWFLSDLIENRSYITIAISLIVSLIGFIGGSYFPNIFANGHLSNYSRFFARHEIEAMENTDQYTNLVIFDC